MILCIIISFIWSLLSCKVGQPIYCRILVTLWYLEWQLTTNLAALLWTASMRCISFLQWGDQIVHAYSRVGLARLKSWYWWDSYWSFFSALSCFPFPQVLFSSNIAKLSSLVSNLARGKDLSVTDDVTGCTKNSDMLECEGCEGLLVLLGVSADKLSKDIHRVYCIILPDSDAGAHVGSFADVSDPLWTGRGSQLVPGITATVVGVAVGMIT